MAKKNSNYKVSKIMIWPNRKINLGNYETVDLNAGVEFTFDKPVEVDSKEITEALEKGRAIIKVEFVKQYMPYRKK